MNDRYATRLATTAKNSVGWILKSNSGFLNENLMHFLFRKPELYIMNKYLENEQYANLPPYNPKSSQKDLDERECQPKASFPLLRISAEKVASFVAGYDSKLSIHNQNVEKQKKIDDFIDTLNLWPIMEDLIPSILSNGSGFIRFYANQSGKITVKIYNSMFCRPVFDSDNNLVEVTIRYLFDSGEINENKEKIFLWDQIKLTEKQDIHYNNPIFDRNSSNTPVFKPVETVTHNIGFVQGQWFSSSYTDKDPEGKSIVPEVKDMIDNFNYRMSKQDDSIFYNLFAKMVAYGISPQELAKNLEEWEYMDKKGYNIIPMHRPAGDSDIRFLETGHAILQIAEVFDQRQLQLMQFALRTVLLDPERIAAHAQSGVAMKALHGPVIEKVNSIRPWIKRQICTLLEKIEYVSRIYKTAGYIEPGTIQESDKKWGTIFPPTIADIAQKTAYTGQSVESRIISRKTATKHIAKDFGVENIEEELQQIDAERQQDIQDELDMTNDTQNNQKNY